MDQLSIIPIDEDMMRKSLKQAHRDFEDGIQMNAASSIVRMQYIITRNLRDFKNSDITAVSAEDYLLREHKA